MEPITPHGFENLGGRPKPIDERDLKLGAAVPVGYTFPRTLTNNDAWNAPVEYQGQQPACGAHAGAKTKGLALNMRATPRFTWGDLKTFDGWPIESGTDIRSIFKSITKQGVLDFAQLGNDVTLSIPDYAKAPTQAFLTLAAKHSGMGYGFIQDLTFNGLKQFIADHGPTIILLRLGNEWWTAPDGTGSWAEKDILPLRTPAIVTSGHFVVAHSYDDDYIYFINSFSDRWGRRGHGFFGANYMPFINDAGALFPLKFTKDLYLGMSDSQVIDLQRYLNKHGFSVALIGPGSAGQETSYFGNLTRQAVQRWQKANGIYPTLGYFGPLSRAFVELHP